MRKTLGFLAFATITAFAVAQTSSGRALLDSFAHTLKEANTVNATYTVQMIGGVPDSYTISLKKPNLARIDTPSQLIVADGKTITTLDKANNSFSKSPETDADLKALFTDDELKLFGGFFNEAAYKAAVVKGLGQKNRKGQTVQVVQAVEDASGLKTYTYFLGADNLARAAQIDLNDPSSKVTFMLDTKSLDINTDAPADAFAFVAPAGASELSLEDANSTQFITDINQAMKIAAKTHKKIFVDFFATWCGPCKMLDKDVLSTPEFKKLSKKLVFLRIDVDAQKSVASQYGITAMPTQMVLDQKGSKLSERVGYSNAADFYGWLSPLL